MTLAIANPASSWGPSGRLASEDPANCKGKKAHKDRLHGNIALIDEFPLRLAGTYNLFRKQVRQGLVTYRSTAEFLGRSLVPTPLSAIIINFGRRSVCESSVARELGCLFSGSDAPLIMLTDHEDVDEVTAAFKYGVRGYFPTSLDPRIAIEALRLIQAGGTFFPLGILAKTPARAAMPGTSPPAHVGQEENWPPRQLAVVRLLVQGKPNKEIARALSMEESTVKVHMRHIMRKLNASNRTEAALRAGALCA